MIALARLGGIVSLLFVVTACSDLVTGGDLIRPGDAQGVIIVQNSSSSALTAVLISDCNVGSYGLNRLPDGATIPPGDSYQFTVSAGCWDVDAGHGGGEARQRMQVEAYGGVRYTVTD